jgi:capsular polysaccharide biosynthesis protein
MGLAAGFGVLFAAGFVIVSEFFDRSFAGERDVMRVLGLRVVASVPQLDGKAWPRPRLR